MNPFAQLTVNTTKGLASIMAGRAVVDGNKEKTVWNQTGVAVDRDTLTIDGTVFELVDLATDSTFDVLTFWNNTDPEVQQTLVAHTLEVGDYVAVETEVARVIYVGGADVVGFKRGVAGSTIAAHAVGTTAINVDDGTALTAGAITVPLDALTAENTLDRAAGIIAEREWLGKNGQDNFLWEVVKETAAIAIVQSTVVGERLAVFSEVLTNGTVLPATGEGGSSHGSMPVKTVYRLATAAEVTEGEFRVICPFMPVEALVRVYSDQIGTLKAWDGAVVFNQATNTVKVGNAGAVDWDATDWVSVTVFGVPVEGEELVSA
jgi:hypothetical protein